MNDRFLTKSLRIAKTEYIKWLRNPRMLIGGILGLLIMLALAVLGESALLTPANLLAFELVWLVPGLLISEWTRAV